MGKDLSRRKVTSKAKKHIQVFSDKRASSSSGGGGTALVSATTAAANRRQSPITLLPHYDACRRYYHGFFWFWLHGQLYTPMA
ncbi:unnamed protein product [Linum trigynum]|uniref:Uncharacterized protein n=1 Tax=Linum trigynum TaxID=586398 RepID=A0AAV2E8S5_9ROSI